jgi:hypothetical protein
MTDLDRIRAAAMARIEQRERSFKLAIAAAALVEALLLAAFLLVADMHDPTHRVILVSAVLVYSTLALGLAALGAHVNRAAERIVAAIELAGAGGSLESAR